MIIRDQIGREFALDQPPERIISLVPSQTELVCDLGNESSLVGVTRFCVHPEHLREEKERVGGTKRVSFKKIRDLRPDLILCNKEENTKEMVAELERIAPIHVSDISTIEDSLELISQYGVLFGKELEANDLIKIIQQKIAKLQLQLENVAEKTVLYFIWKDPYMVAGRNTFIDSILSLNKLRNLSPKPRYPEIAMEEIEKLSPDLIFLSSEPFPFKDEHKKEFSTLNANVEIVDGEFFSWYGSRLQKAMDYFEELRKSSFR